MQNYDACNVIIYFNIKFLRNLLFDMKYEDMLLGGVGDE